MTPDQIFEQLKAIAEKLEITVSEQNLRTSGIPVKSGYCKVKGKPLFIIDKQLTLSKKNKILAEFLCSRPLNDIYVIPKIRAFLQSHQ